MFVTLSKLCIVSQVPAIECQWFSTYLDPNIYSSKIAPARTFCIFEEVYSYIYYMFVITSFHYVLLTCIGSAFTCMNYLIGPLLILWLSYLPSAWFHANVLCHDFVIYHTSFSSSSVLRSSSQVAGLSPVFVFPSFFFLGMLLKTISFL